MSNDTFIQEAEGGKEEEEREAPSSLGRYASVHARNSPSSRRRKGKGSILRLGGCVTVGEFGTGDDYM